MSVNQKYCKLLVLAAVFGITCVAASAAPTYVTQTFATGTSVNTTQPDSITYGDGSIWVSYQNGADSTGLSGSSTVVRYGTTGTVQNSWSIAGNVDGLRIDPSTGLVWRFRITMATQR